LAGSKLAATGGLGDDASRQRPDDVQAGAVLNAALDAGINLIDTASAYHRSEERIGQSIAHRRGEYFLATKCGEHNDEPGTFYDFSYAAIKTSIECSLARLNTERLDCLQIHFGPDPHQVLDDGGCVRAMQEAQAAGQVDLLGASVDGDVLDRCIESGNFQVVQVGCSLLNRAQEPLIQKAADRGIGVLIRSGLAGGWLSGRALRVSPAERPPAVQALLQMCEHDAQQLLQLALQYLRSLPGVSSVLVGTKQIEHIQAACEANHESVPQSRLDQSLALLAEHESP
jgi:aryl-alcohol dehydrogenase-like predicted oxidoreductase